MTHARIPDFSQPIPVRGPAECRADCVVALDLHIHTLEPAPTSILGRALGHAEELLVGVVIIAGGIVLTGLASTY